MNAAHSSLLGGGGVGGYLKGKAAEVAVQAVRAFLQQNEAPEKGIFVVFDADKLKLYEEQLAYLS